jgi:hypothetical protein
MRRWQVLLAAGFLGIASLLLVPFETLVAEAMPPMTLRLLGIINPVILTAIAVLVGEITAGRVGLRAPLVDAWVRSEAPLGILRRQLPPALIVGVIVAAILVIYDLGVGRQLMANAGAQSALASFAMPLAPKLLYGGITEELITRWGLVSLFAWIGWKLARRPERLPSAVAAVAIVAAALLFAAGHLPLLFLIAPHATATVIVAVLAANTLPGILFGLLYVRNGLEAAMIAHAAAHLIATIISAAI